MPKPIWFPFYVNDFLASSKVAMMTTEEIGAYVLLLCHAWQDDACALPADSESIQRLARTTGDLSRVKACFRVKGDRMHNERLRVEWEKVQEQKGLASKAANMRWHPPGNADAMQTHMRTQCSSPSPSPSPSQKNQRTTEPSEKEKRIKTSGAVEKLSAPPTNGVGTWMAYAEAYQARYGQPPVRNAMVNTQCCQLAKRLGCSEAPKVAAFYLTHNDPFYVKKRHPVGLLLQDAEGLSTQWATGTKATTSESRNAELPDEVLEQVKRVETLMKGAHA